MIRNKACKHLEISTTLARRIVTDYSLDYPTNAYAQIQQSHPTT
jgi:hypothetical protein